MLGAMKAISLRADADGVWWWISPEGEPFVSVGINHVEPHLLLGDYNREASIARFGKDLVDDEGFFNPHGEGARRWIEWVTALMDTWQFNTFAYHTYVPPELVRHRYFMARMRPYNREPYNCNEFPDVFDPSFTARVEACVRVWCNACRNEPLFMGYAFEDIPRWNSDGCHGWARQLMNLPGDAPGKQAFIGVLRAHYEDATAAGHIYGIETGPWDWDRLLQATPFPDPVYPDVGRRDAQDLIEAICDQWYRTHVEAVRRYDTAHLILGAKLHHDLPDWLLHIAARYFDVLSIQWYGYYETQAETLAHAHKLTGKPILLGDSAFSVVRPEQEGAKGIHQADDDAMGRAYAQYMEQVMRLPYVVGWHHCGYMEGWKGLEKTFPGNPYCGRQCGFVDPLGKEYTAVTRHVTDANRKAVDWHRSSARES